MRFCQLMLSLIIDVLLCSPSCACCVKAAYGHEECADSLIHHGAAVNAHDVRGRTPLHMAAMCGHVALLGMLLQVLLHLSMQFGLQWCTENIEHITKVAWVYFVSTVSCIISECRLLRSYNLIAGLDINVRIFLYYTPHVCV